MHRKKTAKIIEETQIIRKSVWRSTQKDLMDSSTVRLETEVLKKRSEYLINRSLNQIEESLIRYYSNNSADKNKTYHQYE